MKYRQLTKEQFESLHQEFAHFLASQKIDEKEWKQIKKEKPEVAEEEMNVFSDVVWDDVLLKTQYLEHFSKQSINLFKCDENEIHRIFVKVNTDINLLEQEGYQWLLSHSNDSAVDYFTGTKKYTSERNPEIFDLIEKGSSISKGELFEYFNRLVS
ncbi:MAG: DUF6495 family protein [Polaribacter sp.]|nr:DUF6495 family protein [Polaribacter sp.]